MTLDVRTQGQLLRQLCNHPFLLYQKVREMDNDFRMRRQPKSKCKSIFYNFMPVRRLFPTRYEEQKCEIGDSGKLVRLFEMVTANDLRKIIITYSSKTMELFEHLFQQLNYTIFRIDANISGPAYQEILQKSDKKNWECKRGVVLLNGKFERSGPELIFDSCLIIYDSPDENEEFEYEMKMLARLRANNVLRLVTRGTFEEVKEISVVTQSPSTHI